LAAFVSPLPAVADVQPATTIADILPPTYRLSPKGQIVRDAALISDGTRMVYHDVFGQRIRTVDLATGRRKTIGTNEGGDVAIVTAPRGPRVVYARTDGFSRIRRVGAGGGPIQETSRTSRQFAVANRGATVYYESGGDTWYWGLDGTESQLTAGTISSGAGAPDRDVFVYLDFSGAIRVVTASTDQSAGALPAPLGAAPTGISYTWLGHLVLLNVRWSTGDPTIWLVDTDSLKRRQIGVGDVIHATQTRVLFQGSEGAGYVGFLDQVRAADQVGEIAGTWAVWNAGDDFIVGTNGTTKIRVFSWNGTPQELLDVGAQARISSLAVVGDHVLSGLTSQSLAAVYSQSRSASAIRRVTPANHSVDEWLIGPDAWVYWVTQTAGGRYALFRARRDGRQPMRLTPSDSVQISPIGMFGVHGDVLVFEYAGEAGYWALDLSMTSTISCGLLPATVVGTSAADVVNGTDGPDVITTRGGDDTVRGRGGDDRICLGSGNDFAAGGPGDDRINGSAGDDELLGQGGNDRLHDRMGNNTVDGGGGIDYCVATGAVAGCEEP
jgi:hypothetical protein